MKHKVSVIYQLCTNKEDIENIHSLCWEQCFFGLMEKTGVPREIPAGIESVSFLP